jgi:chorismate dehydratase
MLATHDAALLIGDPALQVDRGEFQTLDLAEEWIRFTGKPFVFAFWAVRQQAIEDMPLVELAPIFQRSRDHGIAKASIQHIAGEWAPRLGLTEDSVISYLTSNIVYFLDESCMCGLSLFYELAAQCGALPAAPELRFMNVARPVPG